jgi:hypothetical protein
MDEKRANKYLIKLLLGVFPTAITLLQLQSVNFQIIESRFVKSTRGMLVLINTVRVMRINELCCGKHSEDGGNIFLGNKSKLLSLLSYTLRQYSFI